MAAVFGKMAALGAKTGGKFATKLATKGGGKGALKVFGKAGKGKGLKKLVGGKSGGGLKTILGGKKGGGLKKLVGGKGKLKGGKMKALNAKGLGKMNGKGGKGLGKFGKNGGKFKSKMKGKMGKSKVGAKQFGGGKKAGEGSRGRKAMPWNSDTENDDDDDEDIESEEISEEEEDESESEESDDETTDAEETASSVGRAKKKKKTVTKENKKKKYKVRRENKKYSDDETDDDIDTVSSSRSGHREKLLRDRRRKNKEKLKAKASAESDKEEKKSYKKKKDKDEKTRKKDQSKTARKIDKKKKSQREDSSTEISDSEEKSSKKKDKNKVRSHTTEETKRIKKVKSRNLDYSSDDSDSNSEEKKANHEKKNGGKKSHEKHKRIDDSDDSSSEDSDLCSKSKSRKRSKWRKFMKIVSSDDEYACVCDPCEQFEDKMKKKKRGNSWFRSRHKCSDEELDRYRGRDRNAEKVDSRPSFLSRSKSYHSERESCKDRHEEKKNRIIPSKKCRDSYDDDKKKYSHRGDDNKHQHESTQIKRSGEYYEGESEKDDCKGKKRSFFSGRKSKHRHSYDDNATKDSKRKSKLSPCSVVEAEVALPKTPKDSHYKRKESDRIKHDLECGDKKNSWRKHSHKSEDKGSRKSRCPDNRDEMKGDARSSRKYKDPYAKENKHASDDGDSSCSSVSVSPKKDAQCPDEPRISARDMENILRRGSVGHEGTNVEMLAKAISKHLSQTAIPPVPLEVYNKQRRCSKKDELIIEEKKSPVGEANHNKERRSSVIKSVISSLKRNSNAQPSSCNNVLAEENAPPGASRASIASGNAQSIATALSAAAASMASAASAAQNSVHSLQQPAPAVRGSTSIMGPLAVPDADATHSSVVAPGVAAPVANSCDGIIDHEFNMVLFKVAKELLMDEFSNRRQASDMDPPENDDWLKAFEMVVKFDNAKDIRASQLKHEELKLESKYLKKGKIKEGPLPRNRDSDIPPNMYEVGGSGGPDDGGSGAVGSDGRRRSKLDHLYDLIYALRGAPRKRIPGGYGCSRSSQIYKEPSTNNLSHQTASQLALPAPPTTSISATNDPNNNCMQQLVPVYMPWEVPQLVDPYGGAYYNDGGYDNQANYYPQC